jgi:hypothetical protein
MNTIEANEAIRQYLLDNYEVILEELLPILDQREALLVSHPHLQQDIKEQFRDACCMTIIHKLSLARADIPGEDIITYIRSLDLNHFLTLNIKS